MHKDIYNYILHSESVLLDVIDNPFIYIFTRIKDGHKCPKCWDDIRRVSRANECLYCYGTGIEGGYNAPEKVKFSHITQVTPVRKETDPREDGKSIQPINIWIQNEPLVTVDDIIDIEHIRYNVLNVQQTTMQGGIKQDGTDTIRQILQIQELPAHNIQYKIPLGQFSLERS